MTMEKAQEIWKEQAADSPSVQRAHEWTAKARRSQLGQTAFAALALGLSFVVMALKLIVVAHDSRFSFANSSVDVAIGLILVLGNLWAMRKHIRQRRQFEALGDDSRSCLDHLIAATREEIAEIRRGMPIVALGMLGLVLLAKWQSIVVGRESTGEIWPILAILGAIVVISGAAFRHRLNEFLKPRLESLQEIRQSFD